MNEEDEIQSDLELLLWEMEVMINKIKELNNAYKCGSGDHCEIETFG